MLKNKSKLKDEDALIVENPEKFALRDFIGILMNSEVEAIQLYDNALKQDIPQHAREVLERIRNDELDHAKDLGELYKYTTAGSVESDVSLEGVPTADEKTADDKINGVIKDDFGGAIKSLYNAGSKAFSAMTKSLTSDEDTTEESSEENKMNAPDNIKNVGGLNDTDKAEEMAGDVSEEVKEAVIPAKDCGAKQGGDRSKMFKNTLTKEEVEKLNLKDSDQPNDMGMVTVGMKLRMPEEYGNTILTVMEIKEGDVIVSMDGNNSSFTLDLEELEKDLRSGEIVEASAVKNEEALLAKFNDKAGKQDAVDAAYAGLKKAYSAGESLYPEDVRYEVDKAIKEAGYSDKAGVIIDELVRSGKLSKDGEVYKLRDSKKFTVKVGDRKFVVNASDSKEAVSKVKKIINR